MDFLFFNHLRTRPGLVHFLCTEFTYKTVAVGIELVMKNPVIILAELFFGLWMDDITDDVETVRLETKQYIPHIGIRFIQFFKDHAYMRFIKFGLNAFHAPDGILATVVRIRCFDIIGLVKNMVEVDVLKMIIQEAGKCNALV